MSENLTYIDLFAGAGGLSEGFIRNGFQPIAHVEMDRDACLTLKTRLAYHYLKQHKAAEVYISYLKKEITRDEFYRAAPSELLNSVINEQISKGNLGGIFDSVDGLRGKRDIDVIVGGPPCQAYSAIGRLTDAKNMKRDSRKFLYRLYARFLEKYKPKVFVFENIPGLTSSGFGRYLKDMLKTFSGLGYKVEYKTLNASDFGVVQNRRRIIIVGWRKALNLTYPEFERSGIAKKVSDVLSDLPELSAGEQVDIAYYTAESSAYLELAGIRNGMDFTTQHIARPHTDQDKKIYRKAITMWTGGGKRLKYTDLPSELRSHKNVEAFLDRFKVVAPELEACHTLVAHIAKDGHYYIHPDLKQVRSLSVREAARIQSFSDDYFFEGSRTSAFKQIGNAVPPLMAVSIARTLKSQLESISRK